MKQIADLHIHSRFSRATSKEGTPEHLELWARKKGISLVGTGDFTHPQWRRELEEKLVPAEDGLYKLREDCVLKEAENLQQEPVRFVISGEISSIYKKNGKTRKVHNLILLPGLEEAQRLSAKLETIGNIHSDGRPILGLDCRDLLEILLELCPGGILIPAHIWTPHFSLFGAFSGFDAIEECFEDLTPYIHALETGLSSDPPMNWRLSALDRFQLVSNSDAHSPSKLGREANLLDTELSYEGLAKAVQEGKGLEGTIEFFPEEGKYHYDGHRKCHVCLSPYEAEKYNGRCPVCGKKLTIGVDHRIVQLADRGEGCGRKNSRPFERLVPLPEVIAASTGHSSASKKVQEQYEKMLQKLGPEFEILRHVPREDIKKECGSFIAEGICRLRAGQVIRRPGFDGEYGQVQLFEPWELDGPDGQMSLFGGAGAWKIEETRRDGKEEKRPVKPGDRSSQEFTGPAQEASAETPQEHPALAMSASGLCRGNSPEALGLAAPGLCRGNSPEALGLAAPGLCGGNSQEHPGLAASGKEPGEGQTGGAPDLQALNPLQRQAVEDMHPVTAVIAGPGTGKTKTLISRILYLLETRKVKAGEITAVTFTNQAAAEMKERLAVQLGGTKKSSRIQIGTFHALCLEYLRKKEIGLGIAGGAQMQELAAEVCREHRLAVQASDFLRKLSLWKCQKVCETDKKETLYEDAFLDYQERMRAQGHMDFDDLLLEALRLFRMEEPQAMRKFSWLLVDEFQDISPLQYALIREWSRHGKELFVIGDPDQSIYGFRGADAACFARLREDFPKLHTINLEENYRCTGRILSAATAVISYNPGQERVLRPNREEGTPVRIVKASGKMAEAVFTAKEILRLIGGIDMINTETLEVFREDKKPWTFRDIAVLYRTHHQARLLEKCLSQEGIPYIAAGREEFLEKPLVRGTAAFFASLAWPENPAWKQDALSLLWELEEDSLSESIYARLAEKYGKKWKRLRPVRLLEEWRKDLDADNSKELLRLQEMAACCTGMEELLNGLLLGEEGDLKRCGGKSYSPDMVHLMTLHGSKGLEFPVVILYGLDRGELPLESEKNPTDEEEERRLFYVGMTRAKEELLITCGGEPSPFLEELPSKELSLEDAGKRKIAEAAKQMSLFDFI